MTSLIRQLLGAGLLGISLLSACTSTPAQQSSSLATVDAPPGSVVVVIDDPRGERKLRGSSGPGYQARLAYDEDPALGRRVTRLAKKHQLEVLEQWPIRNLLAHCFVVASPSAAQVDALRLDPAVRWVQPFNEFTTKIGARDAEIGKNQLGVQSFAKFAEEVMGHGAGVRIAVIDTSIDQTHPDLSQSRVTTANFAGRRGNPDQEDHGTAVVGLISAQPSNPKGISGLARDASVSLLRGCWQPSGGGGKCNTLTLALALDAAVDLDPHIINLSLTGSYDRVLQELVQQLLAQGTLVIAAYDEKRAPVDRFPAPQAGVVYAFGTSAVANGSSDVQHHDSKNAQLVVHAPLKALSLVPNASYGVVSGHSIAAPQVAAMAARLIAREPDAPRSTIQAQLEDWLSIK